MSFAICFELNMRKPKLKPPSHTPFTMIGRIIMVVKAELRESRTTSPGCNTVASKFMHVVSHKRICQVKPRQPSKRWHAEIGVVEVLNEICSEALFMHDGEVEDILFVQNACVAKRFAGIVMVREIEDLAFELPIGNKFGEKHTVWAVSAATPRIPERFDNGIKSRLQSIRRKPR